jgi:hypothetical protein
MARRALVPVLGALGLACKCSPTVILSDCWTHPGEDAGSFDCSASLDKEPDYNFATAKQAGTLPCGSTGTLEGTLGPNDVDVFRLTGTACDDRNPHASWSAAQGRLCLFWGCATGETTFEACNPGANAMHFGDGILGCCVDGPGSVELASSCPSPLDTAVEAWVVVDRSNGSTCEDYSVTFGG